MKRGVLCGEVWAARKVDGLNGQALKLVVHADKLSDRDAPFAELTVAIDSLDGQAGQAVLVAFGSGARRVLSDSANNRSVLADAAIAVLLDGISTGDEPLAESQVAAQTQTPNRN